MSSVSYAQLHAKKCEENPVKTRLLGQAMVEEMSDYTEVLRWGIEERVAVNALVVRGKRKSCDT